MLTHTHTHIALLIKTFYHKWVQEHASHYIK